MSSLVKSRMMNLKLKLFQSFFVLLWFFVGFSILSADQKILAQSVSHAGCKADYNANGTVDIADFQTFGQNYKTTGILCSRDIVGDNCFLDIADFQAFGQVYKVANQCSTTTPPPPPPSSNACPNKIGYTCTFYDEFTAGVPLDRVTSSNPNGKWFTRYIYDNGNLDFLNNEEQRYRENDQTHQITTNGTLKLIARKVTGVGYKYESGMIRSNFSQKNGYFEARIKVPKGRGTWPAFWLNPQDLSWPPEIDILEFFNISATGGDYSPYTSWHFVHPADSQPAPTYAAPDTVIGWTGTKAGYRPGYNFGDDFHLYAVEWTTSEVKFYIDNIHILTRPYLWKHNNGSDGGPAHILLNLAMGDQGGAVDESVLPQVMEIDYVHAYKKN